MDPIDYTSAFANLPSPQDAFMSGVKNGVALDQLRAQREQQQAAAELQRQMQADLAALSANPTSEGIARISLKYPQLSENFKRSFDMLEPGRRQAKIDQAAKVFAALQSKKPEIAQEVLIQHATALRNSGDEEGARGAETMAELVKVDPEHAKFSAGRMLSTAMGVDKFTDAFKGIGAEQRANDLHPDAVRKGQADADTAESESEIKAVTAKYADSQALADLDKKKWDVQKIVADIDFQKQSTRIAAMNASLKREENDLKRQELQQKIDDAKRERDDKLREKLANTESAASSMDNMVNTIDRVLNMAIDPDTKKPSSLVRAATGPLDSRVPTLQTDVADFEALVETLGSQAFMAQVPNLKGMGALSNAEGEKLQAALQNFSLRQSPEQLIANMREAQRLILKGRKNLETKTGIKLPQPDTPHVTPSGDEIEQLLLKYGGK